MAYSRYRCPVLDFLKREAGQGHMVDTILNNAARAHELHQQGERRAKRSKQVAIGKHSKSGAFHPDQFKLPRKDPKNLSLTERYNQWAALDDIWAWGLYRQFELLQATTSGADSTPTRLAYYTWDQKPTCWHPQSLAKLACPLKQDRWKAAIRSVKRAFKKLGRLRCKACHGFGHDIESCQTLIRLRSEQPNAGVLLLNQALDALKVQAWQEHQRILWANTMREEERTRWNRSCSAGEWVARPEYAAEDEIYPS